MAPYGLPLSLVTLVAFCSVASAAYQRRFLQTAASDSELLGKFDRGPGQRLHACSSARSAQSGGNVSLSGGNVSLMVTVTERDLDGIPLRVPRLSRQQHFAFAQGQRLFVVDTHGDEPSRALVAAICEQVSAGWMDGWLVVDYSDAYVKSVSQRAGWTWPQGSGPPTTLGHEGNLVYYFMMDHATTQYVVHMDLDIALWSKPGFSWVTEGLDALRADPALLVVHPPVPAWQRSSAGQARLNAPHNCRFMTARYWLMDKVRYDEIWSRLGPGLHGCGAGQKRHWELVISCAACEGGMFRADLRDYSSAWVLHFPEKPSHDLDRVLRGLVDQGIAVPQPGVNYNADSLDSWLRLLPAGGAVPAGWAPGLRPLLPEQRAVSPKETAGSLLGSAIAPRDRGGAMHQHHVRRSSHQASEMMQ